MKDNIFKGIIITWFFFFFERLITWYFVQGFDSILH